MSGSPDVLTIRATGGSSAKAWAIMKLLARAFLIAFVLVAVVSYIVFSPRVACALFSQILFFPHPANELYGIKALAGVPKQDVFFLSAGGRKLHGWLFEKPGARKTVLFLHGNAGNISHRLGFAGSLLDAGASVFLFDYGGYGLSEGSPDLRRVLEDS